MTIFTRHAFASFDGTEISYLDSGSGDAALPSGVTRRTRGRLSHARLFELTGATRRNAEVTRWLAAHDGALGVVARHWFDVMRSCGDDVRDVMHDGQATACVSGAAFAYVAVYSGHVNVGFFNGASLPDPKRLLQGSGRFMRHVKRTTTDGRDDADVAALIHAAYNDIRRATERSEEGVG